MTSDRKQQIAEQVAEVSGGDIVLNAQSSNDVIKTVKAAILEALTLYEQDAVGRKDKKMDDLKWKLDQQRVMPKELHLCQTHRENVKDGCLSCQFGLDWNTSRRICIECGEPAIGYRATNPDTPVEFYCDEHWKPLDFLPSPPESKETK